MEIRNKTTYDKSLIIRYNKAYLHNFFHKSFLYMALVVTGFSIYFLAIEDYLSTILIIAILISYLFLTILFQSLNLHKILKRSPLVENPVDQEYLFKEDSIFLNGKNRLVLPYDQITKIVLIREFIVIYDSAKKPYIVDTLISSSEDISQIKNILYLKSGKKIR
ncbi:MAG: hypothetical protein Q8M70_00190 [bacterium]|nr:hypothetical protein [bacterium]